MKAEFIFFCLAYFFVIELKYIKALFSTAVLLNRQVLYLPLNCEKPQRNIR